jgi:purine-nucleoside phosphorylase
MQSPQTAAARLKKISPLRPTLAIVLGSGFHHALTELRVDKKVSYAKIPGFPKPGVKRTRGRIVFRPSGQNAGPGVERTGAFLRRPFDGACDVRRPRAGGVWHRDLLLTNAAGGINKNSARAISWY